MKPLQYLMVSLSPTHPAAPSPTQPPCPRSFAERARRLALEDAEDAPAKAKAALDALLAERAVHDEEKAAATVTRRAARRNAAIGVFEATTQPALVGRVGMIAAYAVLTPSPTFVEAIAYVGWHSLTNLKKVNPFWKPLVAASRNWPPSSIFHPWAKARRFTTFRRFLLSCLRFSSSTIPHASCRPRI